MGGEWGRGGCLFHFCCSQGPKSGVCNSISLLSLRSTGTASICEALALGRSLGISKGRWIWNVEPWGSGTVTWPAECNRALWSLPFSPVTRDPTRGMKGWKTRTVWSQARYRWQVTSRRSEKAHPPCSLESLLPRGTWLSPSFWTAVMSCLFYPRSRKWMLSSFFKNQTSRLPWQSSG